MSRKTSKRCVRSLVAVAAMLMVLGIAVQPAMADGFVIPQPPRDRILPWRDILLSVKQHHVEVEIAEYVATTHVDQVFVNDSGFAVEGTYVFPLPEDAAIASFDMWVDGRKQEGKLLGRDEAREIYEEIVRRDRDPALLEYVGRGAFQARIFPIPPGGERRIELSYSQVLARSDGLIHYRYPLSTEKFSARPLGELTISVVLNDGATLRAIYSPSHPIDVLRDGQHRATVSFEANNVLPDRDFDLHYSVSQEPIAVDVVSYKMDQENGYFLFLVNPPLAGGDTEVVAKDVILVLDTSGSMEGGKLSQAKAAADTILDDLGHDDRFNIVSFSTATRVFDDGPVPANRKSEGHAFVRKLRAQGSTDINRALLEAVAGADPTRPTVLIFLTDGLPTTGETDPDRIVANINAATPKSVRLFAFGVGDDVDALLLDELSGNHRGTSAYVRPNQEIDEEVTGFYAKVNAPVLVDIELSIDGVDMEDLYPYPLPDLFAGSQLTVLGRYRSGGRAELTLSGTVNERVTSYTYGDLDFVSRGGNEYVPRLWAQRKIGYLLSQIRLHGAMDELVDEVVALSTRFGIVTPYTSFLVEEPQMVLTDVGRQRLSDALRAPTPGGATGYGGGGEPSLAPASRSGAEAVERAVTEHGLASSDLIASPAAQEVKQVGDKTFLLSNGAWVDTIFDSDLMTAERVVFGSVRYWQLLTECPSIGRYLALGDQVTVVLDGKAYAVSPVL